MRNKSLKSITALLISLLMLASSIPVSAAEQSGEPTAAQSEPTPAQTAPVPAQTESALANTEPAPVQNEPAPAQSEPAIAQPIMTEPAVTSVPQESDPAVTDNSIPGDTTADASADVFGDAAGEIPAEQGSAIPAFSVSWNTLPIYMGNAEVFQWSIVMDNGGYYIYAVTNMYESAQFVITYDEGGEELLRYDASTQPTALDSLWNPIPGAYVQSYVENGTRYSELYIPQSFFKDILFTITCGQSVNSFDITDRFGMPALLDIMNEVSTLEEPAGGVNTSAMSDADFISYVESMAAFDGAGCGDVIGRWGYRTDNENCYIYVVPSATYWYTRICVNGNYYHSDKNQDSYVNRTTIINGNGYAYSEIIIPISQLGGSEMTVGGQTYSLAPGTTTMGSQPTVPDEPEQPSEDTAFIEEVNSAIASANCSGGNWGIVYQNGCYNLYITGNQWGCTAGFNFISGSYSWISADPVNNNPVTINGVSTPVTKIVNSDSTYYALYSIPESTLPAEFKINYNQGDISSDDIKANGTVSEDYRIVSAIQNKLGSENWAIEPGSDGQYHLYIVDTPADNPAVTVTDKTTGEASSPALAPVATAEKDGLRYSEYTLSGIPDWFDISYNGQTKTLGTNPNQAFIDSVTENAGDGWKAVLNEDGSCNIYVVSDSAPMAGDFTFENRVSGDSISIDESSVQTVYDPETGKHYTTIAVANPSEWFNVSYNGALQTVGENPDQAIIDEISRKLGSNAWAVEKGADGAYHIYVKDGVNDDVNITATDKESDSVISLELSAVKQVTDENGVRYTEYTAAIDSDWFDIEYNGDVKTIGIDPADDDRPFLEIAREQTAGGAGDGKEGNNISGWGAVKRSDGYHLYVASAKDVYYYRTTLKSTKYDTDIVLDSNSNNILYGGRDNVVAAAPINDEVDPITGTRYKEFLIPFDRMPESFDITGNDKSVYLDNSTGVPPVYNGIVIDGGFTDWSALEKVPVEEKDCNGNKKAFGVDHMTAVWDGDRVYIYVDTKDKTYKSLFTAGPNNNGVYKITTDLNRTLLIQVRGDYNNPVIYGVEGGEVKIDTTGTLTAPHYMEISFPASELPVFHNSISVGIYGDNESVITISDLKGNVDPAPASEVVIDGYYEDWTYYPHTLIAYDTPGIQLDITKKCDGEQALISHGDEVYGHCVTQHAEHLKETMGGMWEFNISVNNSYIQNPDNPDFKARFLCVGSDGKLHTVREYEGAAMFNENAANMGTPYHYYIVDVSDGSCDGMTLEEFEASGKKYGEAYVTHSPSQWDIEYKLSVEKLAEKVGLNDASDVKAISSQFHMIGPEWVTTAGTSTGAFLGILLCLATVSGTYFYKKKKSMGIK